MEKKTSENNKKKMKMEFGLRIATHTILKELNNDSHQKNLAISPLSLHICLNLLTDGAKGPTLDQLLRFLDSENVDQLNAQSFLFMELADSANHSSTGRGPRRRKRADPSISMVSGIWVDRRFSLKHSFTQLADEIYKAKSQSLDFVKAKQVAREINSWARESSKGHINNLVSSESIKGSLLVLASALYFKGSWIQKFDTSDTECEDFRLLHGKRVRAPFMKQSNTYFFYRSFEGFKLLKMEYKKGQDGRIYAMHIFLPDRFDGLPNLILKFHSDPGLFTQNHEVQNVKLNGIWLPKFQYEYGSEYLSDNIKELGLDLPFGKQAELSGIVDSEENNLFVSKAIQNSYIEVNEKGTVATSITAAVLIGCAQPRDNPPPSIDFVADHPFLFIIKEENSGIVLFVRAVLNPLL